MNAATIEIGSHSVGPGNPVFLIGEVAQAHDGSLGTAHRYIDVVAEAGCQAVKFQTHIAAAESTPSEPFRVKFSRQDDTRFAYWKRLEFTQEQWRGLADHARERGLVFLSSAFSIEAVELLEGLGMPAWKVGSGEVNSHYLIERMAATGKPVLLSSGMSAWEDLDRAVELVRGARAPLALFQCTSRYPCPPSAWGLNLLADMRARYACPIGFSDHSGDVAAGLGAVALGADILEVHVAFSKDCFGPDTSSSLVPAQLRQLADGARALREAQLNPVDKNAVATDMAGLRDMFGKSIVAAADLPEGTVVEAHHLAFRKPGGGLHPNDAARVLGRRLSRAVGANCQLKEEDLGE